MKIRTLAGSALIAAAAAWYVLWSSALASEVLPPTPPPATQKMSQSEGRWTYPIYSKQKKSEVTLEGGYVAFVPPGWDGASPLPLLMSLHGAGYRGFDLAKIDPDEIPKQIREGRVFEAVVLCPQVSTYWSGEQAAAFIDQALKDYAGRYDPERVYLTGESSGAGGTWEGAKLRSAVLAAAVPICTTIGTADGAEKLKGLPIWAFHNIHDPYQDIEKSRVQVQAIRNAGGKFVFLTEYTEKPGKERDGKWPNAHKHAWETAYRTPALWEWLFHQRRGEPERANGLRPGDE